MENVQHNNNNFKIIRMNETDLYLQQNNFTLIVMLTLLYKSIQNQCLSKRRHAKIFLSDGNVDIHYGG